MLGISTFEFITQVLGPKDLKGGMGSRHKDYRKQLPATGASRQEAGSVVPKGPTAPGMALLAGI